MRATASWYGLAFFLAAAVIVAGFWPTFFSAPLQNDAVRTVHGFLASGWLIIVVIQPWLIASGRPALHRAIGRLSVPWVLMLLISMAASQRVMLSESLDEGAPLPARLAIGFVNLVGIPLFAFLYGWGIRCAIKGDVRHHMRLMACTLAVTVPPGLVRLVIRIMHGFGPVPMFIGFGLVILALLALMLRDRLVERRIYAGSVVAATGLAATVLLLPVAMGAPPYIALMRALGYPG